MPLHRTSLADQVGDQVRVWVLDGTLGTDELSSVQQVADRLGVSRGPVREGLLALAESGLIEFVRNRGFRVRRPEARDIAEMFALRLALEPAACRRAAARTSPALADELAELLGQMRAAADAGDERRFAERDHDFHAALLRTSGNQRVVALLSELRGLLRTHGPSTAGVSRSLSDILAEHEPIAVAVSAGEAARAEAAMRQHLVSTGRMLIGQVDSGEDADPWAIWDGLVDEDRS